MQWALVLLLGALTATPAAAEQYWTTAPITAVSAVAKDDKYPQYSDVIYIGFADKSWLPERCRKAPGLLANATDRALLTLALAALEHGRPVDIKAEDGRMIGEYCRVFQITLHAP